MSTKIYNGFIFYEPVTLRSIFEMTMDARNRVRKKVGELFSKHYAKEFSYLYDRIEFGMLPEKAENRTKTSPLRSIVCEDINNRMEMDEKTLAHDAELDFKLSISIHPLSDEKILGMHFVSQESLKEILYRVFPIKEYHYQNQTDKPESISMDEWDQRSSDWGKALFEGKDAFISGNPSMTGILINLSVHEPSLANTSQIFKWLPSYDSRANRIAMDIMVIRKAMDLPEKTKNSDFLKVIKEIKTTEEYKNLFENIKSQLKEIPKSEL